MLMGQIVHVRLPQTVKKAKSLSEFYSVATATDLLIPAQDRRARKLSYKFVLTQNLF